MPSYAFISAALVSLLLACPARGQTVTYVDADAAGANNGSSWVDAFTDLQTALGAAASGDEIWIANASYRPALPGGDRSIAFEIPDGVALYGGFAGADSSMYLGGETQRAQRDYQTNIVYLTGDLNSDDLPDFGNNADNSYQVVRPVSTLTSALLDGLTITAGNANGGGYFTGAGIQIVNASVTIRNCSIVLNITPPGFGAGIYIESGLPVVIEYTRFFGNDCSSGGADISAWSSTPLIRYCEFVSNRDGTAVTMNSSDGKILNCTFDDNRGDPSAIDNWFSDTLIANCVN